MNADRTYATYEARHFRWEVDDGVATITLDRPERKNPLTFESYAELRDLFRGLVYAGDVDAIVITGAGGNFCSGGDVHEIIGPLTAMAMPELLAFTRMTGDVVKAMRACPQPIVAAVDGVCAGAGRDARARIRPALRDGARAGGVSVHARRAGGCRHGRVRAAAAHRRPRPRGRAAVHRPFAARPTKRSRGDSSTGCASRTRCSREARAFARSLADGPTFAHAMTKKMLHQEWAMGLDEAIEAEAQAQAICMQTRDFRRAYEAFAAKRTPKFEGD